ncbi:MAG TPA: GNAT family N-acetyltransferase [Acidimicrobiia bacterium]|nr:GNAT family N-acetyltransferase [Acidimicrobiia bacterium]
MGELEFRTASSDFAEELVDLELRCFPTVDRADLITVAGVRLQEELFPAGGFMVLDGDRVVGMASGVFVDYDISEPQHDLHEVVGDEGVGNHDPDGDWYYGIDIAVDPEYRRRGIARRLYDLRKQLVIDHGKRGIIAGGVIPGYRDHKDEMTAREYVDAVADGRLTDPTLTAQLANGFEVHGVIADYVLDPTTDNYASFIVWLNPHHPDNAARGRG